MPDLGGLPMPVCAHGYGSSAPDAELEAVACRVPDRGSDAVFRHAPHLEQACFEAVQFFLEVRNRRHPNRPVT